MDFSAEDNTERHTTNDPRSRHPPRRDGWKGGTARAHTRFFLRAPLLIATKPVLIGVTERRAPQLLHCMK